MPEPPTCPNPARNRLQALTGATEVLVCQMLGLSDGSSSQEWSAMLLFQDPHLGDI